jgi:hypothetical protein
MDSDLRPNADLADLQLESYNLRRLIGLPLRLLGRQIEPRLPLSQEDLRLVSEEVAKGDPICDKAQFPDCSQVPDRLRVRAAIVQRDELELEFQCQFRRFPREPLNSAGAQLPFCDELPPDSLSCVFLPGLDEAPLPPGETRPFCPQLPVEPELPVDDRVCVLRPGPGEAPLSPNETRPFCPDPAPPPQPVQNDAPPVDTPSPRQPTDNDKPPPTAVPTRRPGGNLNTLPTIPGFRDPNANLRDPGNAGGIPLR